jgi:hypothetical protein
MSATLYGGGCGALRHGQMTDLDHLRFHYLIVSPEFARDDGDGKERGDAHYID